MAELYAAIKPILILSKSLGLISFSFKGGVYKISTFSKYSKILLIIIYVSMTLFSAIMRAQHSPTNPLVTTTDIMQIMATGVQISAVWICSAAYQNKFICFLERLTSTDGKFKQLGVQIRYGPAKVSIRRKIVFHFLFVLVVCAAQIIIYSYSLSLALVSFNIATYLPYFVNVGIVQLSTSFILIVKHRFRILNGRVAKLKENPKGGKIFKISKVGTLGSNVKTLDGSNLGNLNGSNLGYLNGPNLGSSDGSKLRTLRIVCWLHHETTKTAKIMNEVFGVSMLVSFGVSFVTITVSLYYLSLRLKDLANSNFFLLIGPLTMGVTYIFDTLYLCHCCQSTVEETAETARLLHQIDYPEDLVKDQIEMFSLQMANENLQFTAAGFFPVDYTLVFSIIGGVTTYLIILIQFS